MSTPQDQVREIMLTAGFSEEEIVARLASLNGVAVQPTHAVPATQPGVVPDNNAAIKVALCTTKVFGQTPAASAVAPPPDSDYLRKTDLVGVTFTCISVSIEDKLFEGKPSRQAEYKIVIDQRPDLGIRIASLTSKLALAQAATLAPNMFPFKATLEQGQTSGSFAAPFVLSSPRATSATYYHAAEEFAKAATVGFPF